LLANQNLKIRQQLRQANKENEALFDAIIKKICWPASKQTGGIAWATR